MSSGWMSTRWSTRAGVVLERDRHRAHRRELLDVGAQVEAVGGSRARPSGRRCVEAERDRLDEDVERARVLERLREHLLDLVHPAVRGRKPSGTAWASSAVRVVVCATVRELGGELERAQLAARREAVAGLALERRRARARASRRRARCACARTVLVGGLAQRPGGGRDAAAGRARSPRTGTPVTFCSYSSRAPAGERQVGVAVDEARGAARSRSRRSRTSAPSLGLERRDPPVARRSRRAGLERQLAGAVGAQVAAGRPPVACSTCAASANDVVTGARGPRCPGHPGRASGSAARARARPSRAGRSRRRRGARRPCPGRPSAPARAARPRARCRRRRHLAGVDRLAHADAAAVMDRDPARAAGGVEQRVQQRPVGDRVGAVAPSPRSRAGARRPSRRRGGRARSRSAP